MKAVIGALRVVLGADTAAFEQSMRDATKTMTRVGKQMQSVGRSMSAYVTAPLALVGRATVKASADFEQGMANMAAVLRPTQEEFQALRNMAIELAQTTKFTARESADGMEMLARNSIDAANILGGAARATLNLAAAAGSDLPSAADAITDVMVTFRKTGGELDDVVNNIAGTLVNSKMGWDDYVGALGQSAGAAGALGMSFSDMNAILAATAPSFRNGVEAGTSLKGFLLRLAPAGKQAKDIMAALNLEFFDSQGFMKSGAKIAEELHTKLGGLTKQAQAEVATALFGQRSIRTALRMIEEGAEGIERFKAKIGDVSAEDMAKRRMDALEGSVNLFRAAAESAAIAIGDSGLKQWARDLVDAAADLARSLATVNPEILRWGTIMAGVAIALGPAILAAGLFAAAIGAIGVPVAATAAAIGVVTGTVVAFWSEIQIAARMVANAFRGIYEAARTWLLDKLQPVLDWVRDFVDGLGKAFQWLAEKLGLKKLVGDVKEGLKPVGEAVSKTFDDVRQAGGEAADYVKDKWREAGRELEREQKQLESWTRSLETWAGVVGNILQNQFEDRIAPWTKMASTMSSNIMKAGLRRPSDEVDLGTYGTGTFDASAFDDVNRLATLLQQKRDELLSDGQRVFEETRTPAEALRLEFERLNTLVNAGAISWEEHERAVANAQNAFTGVAQAAESISQSMGSAFEGMILDGENWRDSMAKLLKDVAREILRVAALAPLMDSIKSGITGMFGAGGGAAPAIGTWATSVMGFANGGSFRVGGSGGIDSQMVAFRASPNERVSITKPGQGNDRGVTIIQNNEINNADPQTRAWLAGKLELVKRQAVEEAVAAVAKTRSLNPSYARGVF